MAVQWCSFSIQTYSQNFLTLWTRNFAKASHVFYKKWSKFNLASKGLWSSTKDRRLKEHLSCTNSEAGILLHCRRYLEHATISDQRHIIRLCIYKQTENAIFLVLLRYGIYRIDSIWHKNITIFDSIQIWK